MNKRKLTLLCVLLVLAITCASIFLTACNDDSKKKDAVITANEMQTFLYDGKVHNVQATLNHKETSLTYSPSQGFKDVGEYEVTISAAATKNYKATSKKVTVKIISDTVINRWNFFLEDVQQTYAINSGDVKFNVGATAATQPKEGKGDSFKLSAVGNLDLTNKTNNNSNAHVIFGINDDEYGIFYQKGVTYIKINEDIFAVNNLDLASLFGSDVTTNLADENQDETSIADAIISAIPLVLFSNINDIQIADNVWTLTLDMSNIWGKIKSIALPIIGKDILSQENIKFITDFLKTNKTTLTLNLDLNTQNAAKADAEINVSTYGSFKASVTAMEIANGAYETVEGALSDEQIAKAKKVNLANVKIEGTLNLVNTLGETYEHLNWRLVVDIDPIALIEAINSSNGIDWLNNDQVKKMKVYFSLFHKHQPSGSIACTDVMCPTRAGGMDDTTLLDVAFDPQNFGDSKLYVAANLSRILSESSLNATLQNLNGLVASMAGKYLTGLLSENFMTSIDLTKTITPAGDDDNDNNEEEDKVDIKKFINPIFDLLTKAIAIQDGEITLDMEYIYATLDTLFDLNSLVNIDLEGIIKINAGNFKDAVFKGLLSPDGEGNSEKAFKSLSLGISSIEYGNADTFNCKNAITHDPIDSSKARPFEGSKPLSLEDAKAKATGRVMNTKQSYEDYTAEKGIHATIEEFEADVVGKLIEYTYTAMDGKTYTAYTEIIAYEGLDKTKLNVPQTIKAIVLPLDGQGGLFSDTLWTVLKDLGGAGLIGGFLPSNITLPIKADVIDMTVTLTEVKKAQFTMTTPLESTYNLAPYESDNSAKIDMSKHLNGTIDIEYADGYTRTISANCSSDLMDGKYLINDGKEYTITLTHYSMPNVKKDFKVKAETPSANLAVDSAGKITYTTYGPTQGVKINVNMKKSSYSTDIIDPSLYKITIKGQELSDITISATEAGTFDFAELSDIVIKFSKDCYRYESLSSVTPFFYLTYPNGTQSVELKYTKSFKKLGQVETWATVSKGIDLGANLNDKLTYNYWLDSDAEYDAPQRTLTLKYEDGQYYMIDKTDSSVKIQANVTAWDYYDKTKTDILVNGLVPFEKLKELSYDTTNKTSKAVSLYVGVSFMLDGKKVELKDKSISFNAPYDLNYIYQSNVSASSTFDNLAKFTIVKEDGVAHEMRLKFKDGKYVFEDTYTKGDKYADIETTVTAKVDNNNIELADGKIGADYVGKKVTITVSFTYDGKEFTKAVQSNKNIVA